MQPIESVGYFGLCIMHFSDIGVLCLILAWVCDSFCCSVFGHVCVCVFCCFVLDSKVNMVFNITEIIRLIKDGEKGV